MIDGSAAVCYNKAMIEISADYQAKGAKTMLMGSAGSPVSFECSELIAELKQDIRECGKDKLFAVWLRNYPELGIEIAVNCRMKAAPNGNGATEPDERNEQTGRKGARKSPHARRGHWHHFWIGKHNTGERKLVLKWVAPIFINGSEDDNIATIHPVK